MRINWNLLWPKWPEKSPTPDEPSELGEVADELQRLSSMPGGFGYNPSGTYNDVGRDFNKRQHERLLTQIALGKSQLRALAEQKRFAEIQENATVATVRATVVMAAATAMIVLMMIVQVLIAVFKGPEVIVSPPRVTITPAPVVIQTPPEPEPKAPDSQRLSPLKSP